MESLLLQAVALAVEPALHGVEFHITPLFVTWDQKDALEISDRVAAMNHAKNAAVSSNSAATV